MNPDQIIYPIRNLGPYISPDEIIEYKRIEGGIKCRFSSQKYTPPEHKKDKGSIQLYHIRDYLFMQQTSMARHETKDEEMLKYHCPICNKELEYGEEHMEIMEEKLRKDQNPASRICGGYYSVLYFPEDKFSVAHSKAQKKTCFIQNHILYVFDHENNQFYETIRMHYDTLPEERIRVALSFEQKHVLITRNDLKAIEVYQFPGIRKLDEIHLKFNEGFYEIMDFYFLDSITIVILVRTLDTVKDRYHHFFIEKKINLPQIQ